jgi:hypothetical protein
MAAIKGHPDPAHQKAVGPEPCWKHGTGMTGPAAEVGAVGADVGRQDRAIARDGAW